MNRFRIFLSTFWKASNCQSSPNPPLLVCNRLIFKSPLNMYCSLRLEFVSSEHVLFIKTGIYRLQVFETIVPHLHNRRMVPVGARLTDGWPLSPIGVLFHTTRSSSEDWGPRTDGDSDILTLPTIRFLALIKLCQLLISNQPSVIKLWSFYWSNMNLILEFLDGISLIHISVSRAVLLTKEYNISSTSLWHWLELVLRI